MPAELSSSSDEELRTALRRNLRKDSGISRYRSFSRTLFYNDEMVEVRFGTIYCPIRKRHFHTRQARQDPAAFFGNGNLRKNKRPFLSSSSVIILDATQAEGKVELCNKITLEEANDRGFFIFYSIREPVRSQGRPTTSSLLQDFRYTRVVEEGRVTDELGSPSKFFLANDPWVPSSFQMSSRSVVENYPDGRFAFCDMNPYPRICVVDYGPMINMQSMIMDGFLDDSIVNVHAVGQKGMVAVGKKLIYYTHWNSIASLGQFRGETDVLKTPSQSCICSCSNALSEEQYNPFIAVASQHSLYLFSMHAEVPVHMRKLCSFRDTPISALGTFSEGFLAGQVILCGMRNGTIQIRPSQSIHNHFRFDSVERHKGASIGHIQCVRDSFNFVSVSVNGEVKLWDVRFMSQKNPVVQLESGVQVGGMLDVQSAFADDIGCVAYPDGRIITLNIRKCLNLGEYRRNERGKSRLHLTKSASGYQLIDANDHGTSICSLHII